MSVSWPCRSLAGWPDPCQSPPRGVGPAALAWVPVARMQRSGILAGWGAAEFKTRLSMPSTPPDFASLRRATLPTTRCARGRRVSARAAPLSHVQLSHAPGPASLLPPPPAPRRDDDRSAPFIGAGCCDDVSVLFSRQQKGIEILLLSFLRIRNGYAGSEKTSTVRSRPRTGRMPIATASSQLDCAAVKVVPQIRQLVARSLFMRSRRCARFTVSPYSV
jgi:hypothetical protein